MLPHVTIFNAMSVDGRMDWYLGDMDSYAGFYYGIAARWEVQAVLAGSATMRHPEPEIDPPDAVADPPQYAPDDNRQWLVVVDSRGQIRNWQQLRREPWWRDVIVLCSKTTPQDYLDYLERIHVQHLILGEEHVDLRAALETLAERYGVRAVRVDSGGILNGVLLREGLVDEVSVLLHPYLVGGMSPSSLFKAPDLTSPEGIIPLKLTHVETVGEGVLWLRYEVTSREERA